MVYSLPTLSGDSVFRVHSDVSVFSLACDPSCEAKL